MAVALFNHPLLCNYYLTYRCNAKCGFCDIWEKPSPFVDVATAERNLQALKRLGVRVVDFTGGEPLLHRELPALLRLAKRLGFITTVTTNTLLYPKYGKQLSDLVDMLHFSLDYPDEERHNASRGVACYQHFVQSLALAQEWGERPDILYTVTEDSLGGVEEVYERFAKPTGNILILNPVFEYGEVGSSLSAASLKQLTRWGRKRYVYLNKAFLGLRKAGGNDITKPLCRAGSSSIVISPQNELVLPCYHLGLQALPIEQPLDELWRSATVQEAIKQEGRLPQCAGCSINCYMQPSFAYQVNRYFWQALPSTLKYSLEKWVMQRAGQVWQQRKKAKAKRKALSFE